MQISTLCQRLSTGSRTTFQRTRNLRRRPLIFEFETTVCTGESEIISLAEAIKETINLKLLLEELELRPPDSPVPIHEDNSAATIMSTNEGCHPKAKHYRVRLAFIRENTLSRDGAPPVVTIHQTPTLSQLADGFTKSLTKDLFRTFQNAVLSPPIPPIKESNQEPSTSAVREN